MLEEEAGWQLETPVVHGSLWVLSYAISLLGVLQIWGNALRNQAKAVTAFRRAMALGGAGASVQERYAAAGARMTLDADLLQQVMDLAEQRIEELEQEAGSPI